jgi:hypothetical protein
MQIEDCHFVNIVILDAAAAGAAREGTSPPKEAKRSMKSM